MNQLRRGFAKTLGFASLITIGVAGYKHTKEKIVYKQDELPTAELEKQIEGKPVLQLTATYGEEVPRPVTNDGNSLYIFSNLQPCYKPGTEINVKVNIVPGPDGKLYVKENGIWRKI